MKYNIDQFSPMRDTGTDKATEQPAFISRMNNCYVNSGNILPIKLPKGNLPEGWTVLKEIHTADSIICDISSTAISGIFTLVYDKKTGGWEPAAPALGGLTYNGPGTYAGINGEVRLCNILAGLKKSNWTTTTFTAAAAKCIISDDGKYILYLVAGTYPVISRDGGVSFSSLSWSGGALGNVTDFVCSKSFQNIYLASGTLLWKSTDYGVSWVSVSIGAAIQKLSWFTSSNIYIQASSTTGKVYDVTAGVLSVPGQQGLGVDNVGDGNSDSRQFGSIVAGGVIQRYDGAAWAPGFFSCPRYFSDEPSDAVRWAFAKNAAGPWYDETNKEVKAKAGRIVYMCRTYGIHVERSGDYYSVYKDDVLVANLSAVNQNRYKGDGSSLDEWVANDTDIIGASGAGLYLVFRSKYYCTNAEYTAAGIPRELVYGIKKLDLSGITGIKKVSDWMNSVNLAGASIARGAASTQAAKSFAFVDAAHKALASPNAKYVAVMVKYSAYNLTGRSYYWVGYGYFDVTTDTSTISISEVPVSGVDPGGARGLFAKSSSVNPSSDDFRATISLTGDNYVVGAGQGTYAGKIIKVPISSIGKISDGSCYTGTVTIIGTDEWGTQTSGTEQRNTWHRGAVKEYSSCIVYEGVGETHKVYSSSFTPATLTSFYSISGTKYYPGERASSVRMINSFIVADMGGIGSAIVYCPTFTKITTRGNNCVIISGPKGLSALYLNQTRYVLELITAEANVNCSAYIDTKWMPGDAVVSYSGAGGIVMRDLIASTTTVLKAKAAGAKLHITKGYGVVLDGYISLIGCGVSPDGTIYEITPSLSREVLSLGADVPYGVYSMSMKRKMEYLTSVIDPTTATEVLVFMDQSGMIYKKHQGGFSIPFFGTDVFTGIGGAYTYFPYLASMFNARFAMAGGFALTGEDQIVNGGMTTDIGWAFIGASSDGTKVTIQSQGSPAYNFIAQQVAKDCIYVATVNDPSVVKNIDQYAVIKVGTGVYNLVYTTPTKIVEIASNGKGNIIVTAVHAYTIERTDTSVYISDQTEYEEFYAGTGSIQKLPALGIKFTGMVAIGDSLYLVRDGSTAKISETGSDTNPFAVVEEFVRQGGQYPFKCLQTFAVVRKATAKGADTGDIYLFSGTDYAKLNTVWNSPYDRPFSYNKVLSAEVNGMTILSQNNRAVVLGDSGRNFSIETHQGVEKIGELSLGGIVGGDINEDVFVTQPEQYDVTVCFTAGQPNTRKRVRKVNVLPEQSCGITVETVPSSPANGAAAFNVTGRDINVVVDIAEDSFIEGMQFEADVIMPTERR